LRKTSFSHFDREKHMKFMDTSSDSTAETPSPELEQAIRNVVDRFALEDANRAEGESGPVDRGLIPIKYTTDIFGKWQIDHGRREFDYMVQMIPRKEILVAIGDICSAIIATLSEIVPSDVEVYINPPNSRLHVDFYTIRLEGVMRRPGAEAIVCRKVPAALGAINAWPR